MSSKLSGCFWQHSWVDHYSNAYMIESIFLYFSVFVGECLVVFGYLYAGNSLMSGKDLISNRLFQLKP